jgi:hypothetical protein
MAALRPPRRRPCAGAPAGGTAAALAAPFIAMLVHETASPARTAAGARDTGSGKRPAPPVLPPAATRALPARAQAATIVNEAAPAAPPAPAVANPARRAAASPPVRQAAARTASQPAAACRATATLPC